MSHQLFRLADDCSNDEGFVKIEEHKGINGELSFGVRLDISNKHYFRLMKNGYPSESAEYILQNNIGRTRARNNRNNFVL